MNIKKYLRKLRLPRSVYYTIQFRKQIKNIPNNIFEKNRNELSSLKNRYQGKRCFIIGNGPSLKSEDLDMLKDEYTFASNRIFNIFNETDWRPTFYCCQDGVVLDTIIEQLKIVIPQVKNAFIATTQYAKYKNINNDYDNLIWFPLRYLPSKKNLYRFSDKIDKEVYEGLTVTYSCMQLAAYMGFSEIYLLGVDHNYNVEFDADGNIISENKNLKNYFGDEKSQNVVITPPKVIEMSRAFISANKISNLLNFKIFNATRGGKLEIFERINFDKVVKGEKFDG